MTQIVGKLKPQTVMKLKNSSCDETQKLNLLGNSKLNLIKLYNANCDKT